MTVTSFVRTAAVLLLSLLAAGAAHAVYRCGNVYQDRPCDDKGPQTHLTPGVKAAPAPAPATGGSPAQAAGASPFAPACARVGDEAQKIAWKREGGATQEKLMAELPNQGSRSETAAIIDSVYRKRGSAPEIRAAVEAECIAQKQQAADTAAALAALRAQQAQQGGSAPASAAPDAAGARPAASAQKTAQPAGPSASCTSLKASLDSVNADLRRGGNANNMEQLHHRRRSYEQAIREGRC